MTEFTSTEFIHKFQDGASSSTDTDTDSPPTTAAAASPPSRAKRRRTRPGRTGRRPAKAAAGDEQLAVRATAAGKTTAVAGKVPLATTTTMATGHEDYIKTMKAVTELKNVNAHNDIMILLTIV